MKLKTKTITVYTGDDGQEYDDFKKATLADLVHLIKDSTTHDMTEDEVAEVILKHRNEIADIIRRYNKIDAQKPGEAKEEEPRRKDETRKDDTGPTF